MSDLQLKGSPQHKEKVGPADLAFVAFVVIITIIAVMLTLIQIHLQNPSSIRPTLSANQAATSVALATWQSSMRSFAPHPC
jgi:hypothetical protein